MLSCAYILPDPCTLRPPDRFRVRFIYIFTWHGGSYCIDWRSRNRLHRQRPLLSFLFFSFFTPHWSPVEPYLDREIRGWKDWVRWDHSRWGEIFLAWGWTCTRNALQDSYRASLGRGTVANNVWVSISFLGNCCFPSELLYEPWETKSVKHKGPAMQLHYAFSRSAPGFSLSAMFTS